MWKGQSNGDSCYFTLLERSIRSSRFSFHVNLRRESDNLVKLQAFPITTRLASIRLIWATGLKKVKLVRHAATPILKKRERERERERIASTGPLIIRFVRRGFSSGCKLRSSRQEEEEKSLCAALRLFRNDASSISRNRAFAGIWISAISRYLSHKFREAFKTFVYRFRARTLWNPFWTVEAGSATVLLQLRSLYI